MQCSAEIYKSWDGTGCRGFVNVEFVAPRFILTDESPLMAATNVDSKCPAISKAGAPHSFNKLRRRREKNEKRRQLRENIADKVAVWAGGPRDLPFSHVSSYCAVLLWKYFKPHCLECFPSTSNDEFGSDKALVHFFSKISVADVNEAEVAKASTAYLYDKFEHRIEVQFAALCCLYTKTDSAPGFADFVKSTWQERHSQPAQRVPLKIVSVGGGPGNDLVGAIAFFKTFLNHRYSRIATVSYDFSQSWKGICEVIHAAMLPAEGQDGLAVSEGLVHIFDCVQQAFEKTEHGLAPKPVQSDKDHVTDISQNRTLPYDSIGLKYQSCDLKLPATDPVNRTILHQDIDADVYLFSHVVYETNACAFELLPTLLKHAKHKNVIFIFLDPHQKTMNEIRQLACACNEEVLHAPNKGASSYGYYYEIIDLGSSADYPFKGVCLFRTRTTREVAATK